MIRRPPRSPLFPYTPLSRSSCAAPPPDRAPPRAGRASSPPQTPPARAVRSEEHTSELQSLAYLVCRLLLEKKKKKKTEKSTEPGKTPTIDSQRDHSRDSDIV